MIVLGCHIGTTLEKLRERLPYVPGTMPDAMDSVPPHPELSHRRPIGGVRERFPHVTGVTPDAMDSAPPCTELSHPLHPQEAYVQCLHVLGMTPHATDSAQGRPEHAYLYRGREYRVIVVISIIYADAV